MHTPDPHSPPPPGIRPGLVAVLTLLIIGLSGIWVVLRRARRAELEASSAKAPEAMAQPPASGTFSSRPSPGRGRGPSVPAPATVASTSRDPAEQLDPDVSDTSRFSEPGYVERLRRHTQVRSALESPARHTPEFKGIAALCEQHGFGTWAVSVAYNVAYERRRTEKGWTKFQAEGVPTPPEVLEMAESAFVHQVHSLLGGPETPVDPRFIEALRRFSPEVFIGPNAFTSLPGEPMVDAMDWPTWHARMAAPAPP